MRFAVNRREGDGRELARLRDSALLDEEVEGDDRQVTKSVEMEDVELGDDRIAIRLLGLGDGRVWEAGRIWVGTTNPSSSSFFG